MVPRWQVDTEAERCALTHHPYRTGDPGASKKYPRHIPRGVIRRSSLRYIPEGPAQGFSPIGHQRPHLTSSASTPSAVSSTSTTQVHTTRWNLFPLSRAPPFPLEHHPSVVDHHLSRLFRSLSAIRTVGEQDIRHPVLRQVLEG